MTDQDDLSNEHRPPRVPARERPAAGGGLADGTERALDPASIMLERIGRAIFTAVLAGGSFVALTVFLFTTRPERFTVLLLLLAWAMLVALLAATAWFWPPIRFRHTAYRLDENGIRIRRGVIWRSVVSVPQSRVQHTDVSQGPIERSLGLATLIVHTAGTQNAAVSLGGLSHPDALLVRDYLIDVDERDAV